MKRKSATPRHRLLPAMLAACLLFVPQLAFACDGALAFGALAWLLGAAFVFSLPAVPAWAAKWLWTKADGRVPGFGVFAVSSAVLALLLAGMGLLFVPAFNGLYVSFGADLPVQTLLVTQFNYLLAAPAIVLALLALAFRGKLRGERFFAVFAAGESALVSFTLWAVYSPIFRMC